MLKFVVDGWDKHHLELRQAFERGEFSNGGNYKDLLALTLYYILPEEDLSEYGFWEGLAPEKITKIDFGDYQGTLILVVPARTYQPSARETFYTVIEYGSCSGCDSLMHAQSIYYKDEDDGDFSTYQRKEQQVDMYMTLALHLMQRLKSFEE